MRHFTIPTRALERHLPTERGRNLAPTSCTVCDAEFWTTQWARSGDHGGMLGKWWHIASKTNASQTLEQCLFSWQLIMGAPWSCPLSGGVRCQQATCGQQGPRPDRRGRNTSSRRSLQWATLKLSDFWLGPVPAKIKAGQTQGTLKFPAWWKGLVPGKDQGWTDTGATLCSTAYHRIKKRPHNIAQPIYW